jgi:hypothetical protein
MARSGQNNCGCCAGVDQETPVKLNNLPSQTSISYRIGTHSKFKKSMLAALTNAERPALLPLGTRDDDDFTIAYLDGVATILDILTFYQERYVNENFLATSTERRSVLEMAQLIGYQLSPGVAAATHLAFTLQSTPGTPTINLAPITIPTGTRVQSVPGQDEDPQIFETAEDIEARAMWNSISAQTTFTYVPSHGDLDIYIDGVSSNIEIGDAILIVGRHRMDNSGSERWDIRVVNQVEIDNTNLRTRLVWDVALGHTGPTIHPADTDVRLFVFRKRTSLFGHNAPDPRLMSPEDNELCSLLNGSTGINLWWNNYNIQNDEIDLASPEDKVVADSWIALVSNESGMGTADLPGYVELYRVKKVSKTSRTDYGMSGKITRIEPDTEENLGEFRLQETLALVASEELTIHRRPLLYPVFGDTIKLEDHIDGLIPGQYLSVSGRHQRLKVSPDATGLQLEMEESTSDLFIGDSVQLVATPEKLIGSTAVQLSPVEFGELINNRNSSTALILTVTDRDGSTGTVTSHASDWVWDSSEDDPLVAEIAQIGSDDSDIFNDRDRTFITLTAALSNIYQRDTVQINFNVAPANHGETVTEILGNGNARATDQNFVLKQSPLTYVSADTPSGAVASLEVRVNELRWSEASSLYQADSDARVYEIQNCDDGTAAIRFGDGIEGGRLPTGQTNVRAVYRKYIGADANLDNNKLTTLLQKPLGVNEVTNPEASTGGADPEVIDDAKQNAPLTVLTLDRAVSVLDYQHYARAFSGVAKAHALWINAGPSKGVFITLAGIDGAAIPDNSSTYTNLVSSLRRYGDPMLPLTLVNYTPASFLLGMAVKVNEDAVRDTVLEELEAALREHFSFANRDFGQHVSQDEILAVAHSFNYVEAVRITRFYKDEPGAVDEVVAIIPSHLPVASLTIEPVAAELLTISGEPIEMGTFS